MKKAKHTGKYTHNHNNPTHQCAACIHSEGYGAGRGEVVALLGECCAGLDLKHPEYYENQGFVVFPAKYLAKLKENK